MKSKREKVTIKIPRLLYENLSERIERSGFHSVTEFIVYVLRNLISSTPIEEKPSLSQREIEIIRKRLRSLGYL